MCKQINGRIATDRHGKSANKQNKAQALPRLKESAVNRVTDLTNKYSVFYKVSYYIAML